ncbi:universal stress protein [Castellaniella sp.]|uniref:universal stress protein n=1 Tax=Castellaniella sp. TaxID=1955812 RepID=UPI002AFEEFFD|nr:universal stress protein [Castellaniella sp.]
MARPLSTRRAARPGIQEMYLRRAQQLAESGIPRARMFTDTEVRASGQPGDAANALVEGADHATLLVIGHRTRGILPDIILGSVAFKVTSHATCPVAVVRKSPRPLPSDKFPVVVGVDGSKFGVRALDEAAHLAAETNSFLRIVVAWKRPNWDLWSLASSLRPADNRSLADQAADEKIYQQVVADTSRQAETIAQQAIDQIQQRYPDLRTESVITEGPADQAILAAASDASMIAVGARGLGDLPGLQIGSISRKVMQRAECAVYVVR